MNTVTGFLPTLFLILKGLLITFRVIISPCFPGVVIITAYLLVILLLLLGKYPRTSASEKDVADRGRPMISLLQLGKAGKTERILFLRDNRALRTAKIK